MSELNFPKNPSVGQEYNFNSLLYMFDGVKWVTKGTGYNPVQDLYEMLASDAGAAFVGANGYDNVQDAIEELAADDELIHDHIDSIEEYLDELTVHSREALRRSYAEAGYTLVAGSFEAGGTLTSTTDVLLLESTGTAYAWTGAYPVGGYDVAPGTDPTVVVGFELRKNVALRDDLAGMDGANLVGGATYAALRSYTGGATTVYVIGRSNAFDKAQGYFDKLTSTPADNDGTILVDALGRAWGRRFTGPIRLEWFVSPETDATTGLTNAHAALPSWGGTIAATGLYYVSSPVTFTKRCNILGDGAAEADVNSGTLFKKLAACNGDAFTFTGGDSGCSNLTVSGQAGNTGTGITLLGGRPKCENISVYGCGTDGIRIGADGNGYNQNAWRLKNIKAKFNGRWGIHISDKVSTNPTLPDCNGGILDGADLQYNGAHGLHLGAAQINTFIGVVSQTNTGRGINLSQYAYGNTFIGGDSESNTEEEILCATGSKNNTFIGISVFGTITDSGTNNSFLNTMGDGGKYTGLKLMNVPSSESTVLDWYEEADISSLVSVNFSTPGDSVFNASKKIATMRRIGNRIAVNFVVSGSFTYTTASGVLRITGLPVAASSAIAGNVFTGPLNARGVTTSRSTLCAKVNAGESQITFQGSGSGVAYEVITATNVASGSTLQLEGYIEYTCAE